MFSIGGIIGLVVALVAGSWIYSFVRGRLGG